MSQTTTTVTRRQFCTEACQVASCATIATLVSACGGGSPTSPSGGASDLGVLNGRLAGSTVQVTAAGSAIADVGGAVLVQSTGGKFLVARTGANSFSAIEAICTHEGCTITGAAGDIYVCPCHGSRYNRNGQVVNGPAKSSLRQYPTTFADGVLTIAL